MSKHWLVLGLLAFAPLAAAAQQPAQQQDPLDPAASVSPVAYRSVFREAPPAATQPPTTPDQEWRAANKSVAQAGAHAGHVTQPAESQSDAHAGHGTQPKTQPDPHAGHGAQPKTQPDPHAGHGAQPKTQPDPHAGHGTHAKPAPAAPAKHDSHHKNEGK